MTNRRRILLSLSSLVLLTACATGAQFVKEPAPSSNEALIYIYRTVNLNGAGQRPDVLVDGERLGPLSSGGYFAKQVAPGSHVIVLTGNNNPFKWNFPDSYSRLQIAPGQTRYFRYSVKVDASQGQLTHRHKFEMTDYVTALAEMANLHKAD